jgi:hypothetical protein
MQTKIKILLPIIALFMSAVVSAQSSFYTATTTNNSRLPEKETSIGLSVVADNNSPAFRLSDSNPGQRKIGLEITHKGYGVVVDTSFTSGQFICRYNFDQADDGSYQITLISGKERIKKTVEINTVTTRNAVIE